MIIQEDTKDDNSIYPIMNKLIVIVLASILCASCDTFLHLSGAVVDSVNKLPVDSVRIYIVGWFNISQMTVGGFLGYPGIKISLEKEGYKALKKKYKNWNEKPVVINLSKE